MIDPRTVMITIPAYGGRTEAELTGMISTYQGLYAALSVQPECSHVQLVRNIIADVFMSTNFEWMIGLDADTIATRRDLELLLEPADLQARYASIESFAPQNLPQTPSRVVTALTIDDQDPHSFSYDNKYMGAADLLVASEYSFKNDTLEPCRNGLGFYRVHRTVFERLQALKHDGGPTVEVQRHHMERLIEMTKVGAAWQPVEMMELCQAMVESREDKAGQPRIYQTWHEGRQYWDYYPSGPLISQYVPGGSQWMGEDAGFFTLCQLAGIQRRIETRTRLLHVGRKAYPYLGPTE